MGRKALASAWRAASWHAPRVFRRAPERLSALRPPFDSGWRSKVANPGRKNAPREREGLFDIVRWFRERFNDAPRMQSPLLHASQHRVRWQRTAKPGCVRALFLSCSVLLLTASRAGVIGAARTHFRLACGAFGRGGGRRVVGGSLFSSFIYRKPPMASGSGRRRARILPRAGESRARVRTAVG